MNSSKNFFDRKNRRGFTLIELLVVIAIIAVLIALLVPAVQKVRESANRASCGNNLRQVGLALHMYESVNKKFPYGRYTQTVNHGMWIYLLPYFEQNDLAKMYDMSKDWRDAANKTARETPVSILLCPSTPITLPRPLDSFNSASFGTVSGATCDYTALNGIKAATVNAGFLPPYSSTKQPSPGILETNRQIRTQEVTDGLSNTLFVVEDAGRPEEWFMSTMGSSRTGGGQWADDDGQISLDGYTYDGQTAPGPCPMNCNNRSEIYSFHVNGSNIVFGDGSVRYISNGIDIAIIAYMITRAGNEILPGSVAP